MPVNGWVLPIVMVLAVTPGAEACNDPFEDEVPPHAASSMLGAARAAMGARPSLRDLFMEYLPLLPRCSQLPPWQLCGRRLPHSRLDCQQLISCQLASMRTASAGRWH